MKIKIFLPLFFLLFSLYSNSIFAQNETGTAPNKHKLGFITGYGNQNYLNLTYDYTVTFFQLQYYYTLSKKQNFGIELLTQPQYNITHYRHFNETAKELNGYEFGVNVGFLFRRSILKNKMSAYILLSLGPHYVSGTPDRQANGFIFSDNLFVGITVKLFGNISLDIRPGFRHMSNASLKKPNRGINTTIISGGILFDLK